MVVGEEHQRLVGLGIPEADATQMFGVGPPSMVAVQGDGLIADDAGRSLRCCLVNTVVDHVRFGPRDEKGPRLMQSMKPLEVNIAAIHHVNGASFRYEQIEDIDVVQFAVGNVDETRDVSTQVKQRVHLHRRLGRPEVRPRKDRQAQVNGRRIQGIDGSASPSIHTMEKSSEQTRHCCSISLNRRIRGSSRTSGMLGISS